MIIGEFMIGNGNDLPLALNQIGTQHLEEMMLKSYINIELWFAEQWNKTPPVLTSSVDLRHFCCKIAPVDTNLFPAGYNNLDKVFEPVCLKALKNIIVETNPKCKKILLIPESHTRNQYYIESLKRFYLFLRECGYTVKLGNLEQDVNPISFEINDTIISSSAIILKDDQLVVENFEPCLIILNNDLSSGMPRKFKNINQKIVPAIQLGWFKRQKSKHFHFYEQVVMEFSNLFKMDPWLISSKYHAVNGIDFMAKKGMEKVSDATERLLNAIAEKYKEYNIQEKPYVVIKADNGTYGMGIMSLNDPKKLFNLNRKQRTNMSTTKGGKKLTRFIIQEGVYTSSKMQNGAVAEPVIYLIGQYIIGAFYRLHKEKNYSDNLNTPGMQFEPLIFPQTENSRSLKVEPNWFYLYAVIARLAAVAAAREQNFLRQE